LLGFGGLQLVSVMIVKGHAIEVTLRVLLQ